MKIILSTIVAAMILLACGGHDKKAEEKKTIEVPQVRSRNSEAFNQSFEKLLSSYYQLKDALVDYDTVKANAASKQVALHADSLQLYQLSKDSSVVVRETASNYTGTINGSAQGFIGESDIIKKKREFQMISDAMYDLAKTVRYDQQKIYHQHCPMAFNEENEAYWLSNSDTIVNPYLGRKHPKYRAAMVGCGDIADSLGYVR